MAPEAEPRSQPRRLCFRSVGEVACISVDERRLPLQVGIDQPHGPEGKSQYLDTTHEPGGDEPETTAFPPQRDRIWTIRLHFVPPNDLMRFPDVERTYAGSRGPVSHRVGTGSVMPVRPRERARQARVQAQVSAGWPGGAGLR